MNNAMRVLLVFVVFLCSMTISYWLKEIVKALKDKNV
jgi:hypothetical protein